MNHNEYKYRRKQMFRKDKTLEIEVENIIIKNIFIMCIVIILFVLSAGSAKAYVRPEFSDGIAGAWHPGSYCVPCHYTLAGTEKAKIINSNCDNCHKYRPEGAYFNTREINKSKIIEIHVNMVCIRCHVGLKSQSNITAADFHRVMSKTACLSCHEFDNGTYIKPLKNKCSDCHSRDPHVAHGDRLEKLCVACHGDFGEKYANKSIEPGDKMIPYALSNISNISKFEKPEYQTIGQLIIKLIEQITQIIR